MKNLTRLFLSSLILSLATVASLAQTPKLSPLRTFLQQDADTTIVFQYTTNWLGRSFHYAYFMCKKDAQIKFYAHRDFVWDSLPHTAENQKPLGGLLEITQVPEARNKFFNPLSIAPEQLNQLWADLMSVKPWLIRDDKLDGEGCPEKYRRKGNSIEEVNIYDGGGIQLSLLTRNQVKILDFYAPDYYEKQCRGRAGRKAILKIAAMFDPYIE